jgi:hypothetical protein
MLDTMVQSAEATGRERGSFLVPKFVTRSQMIVISDSPSVESRVERAAATVAVGQLERPSAGAWGAAEERSRL